MNNKCYNYNKDNIMLMKKILNIINYLMNMKNWNKNIKI